MDKIVDIRTLDGFEEMQHEFLARLVPEETLAGLTPEERLAGLSPEQVVRAIPIEVLREFPDSYIATLPDDVRHTVRARLNGDPLPRAAPPPRRDDTVAPMPPSAAPPDAPRSAPTRAVLGRLRLAGPPLRGSPSALAAQWRGAAGQRFPGDVAFHGHDGARTVARYPEVQYRWVDGAPCLYALGDAAERAMAHPWPGATLTLGGEAREVAEVSWRALPLARSFARRLVRYAFGAPWLPLNQENHARYRALDAGARRAELDRILVGNLLTMSQAFGWFFGEGELVFAAAEPAREGTYAVKDVPHLGFEGTFVTNLALPDHLALGRAVSHGFGWFTRLPPADPAG